MHVYAHTYIFILIFHFLYHFANTSFNTKERKMSKILSLYLTHLKQLELSISMEFFWCIAWPYKEFSQHPKKEEQHHPGLDHYCIAVYWLIIHSHFP